MTSYKFIMEDPSPTDQEIAAYQNFDQLLQQHQQSLAVTKRRKWWKWGSMILAGVIISTVSLYFIREEKPEALVEKIEPNAPQQLEKQTEQVPEVAIPPQKLPVAKEKSTTEAAQELSSTAQASQQQKSVEPKEEVTEEKEESFVEAQPVAGYEALYTYFAAHLQYPEQAMADSIQGSVLVEFVIDKQGKVASAEIVQGVQEDINQEALRLIHAMPAWSPALINGSPLATKHTIPLTFQLTD